LQARAPVGLVLVVLLLCLNHFFFKNGLLFTRLLNLLGASGGVEVKLKPEHCFYGIFVLFVFKGELRKQS